MVKQTKEQNKKVILKNLKVHINKCNGQASIFIPKKKVRKIPKLVNIEYNEKYNRDYCGESIRGIIKSKEKKNEI